MRDAASALRLILGSSATILWLGSLLLVSGCSRETPPPKQAVVDVTAITVQPRDAPVIYEFVGQSQSSREVEIRARVEGFLEKRVYTEGALVREGQALFLMDRKPFEAALQQARGELAQQQARHQVATANLARVKPLAAQNAVSQRDLDDAVGNEKTTRAAVLTAQGSVRQAELNLSYATIATPLTGLSSFAKIQEGAYINASNNLLTTVAQLDPMWINFSVSENQHLRLREAVGKGQIRLPEKGNFDVELVLADGSVYQNRGSISFADPSFSKETGTFLVRATFENPDGTLKPGQFVRVHVLGATRPNAILVPQRAVQQGAKSHFVWVVGKEGKAEQRAVGPGDWVGDDWVIEQGLQAGEQVVVDGAIRVRAGASLKVAGYSPPKPAAASAVRTTAGRTAEEKAFAEKGAKVASMRGPPSTQQRTTSVAEGKDATAPLPARVHFPYRQATLDEKASSTISAVAAALKGGQEAIEVTGYADKRGSTERNRKIADARAKAVRDALIAAGVEKTRVVVKQSAIITGSGSDDEARRVEITLGRPNPG
jgi:membrane fusion protein (multidrug efflux system)